MSESKKTGAKPANPVVNPSDLQKAVQQGQPTVLVAEETLKTIPSELSPHEFRNNTIKEAGEARLKKQEKKEKEQENLIKLKQLRTNTLEKLHKYLQPFNNNIVNINQPLKVELKSIDGTLQCHPLFSINTTLNHTVAFKINVRTDRDQSFQFCINPDGSENRQNVDSFKDLLDYIKQFLIEGLSNS